MSDATQANSQSVPTEDQSLRWYAAREPVVLLVLSLLAALSFLAVAGLARAYFRQQQSLGDRWFSRGVAALQRGQSEQAADAFHTALRYSPNDYNYQLSLAQALAALHRPEEARSYLQNLWEREPENGTTNLELGRIYAAEGDTEDALRHYHNAIYAAWPTDPDGNRRVARLELIDFLLRQNAVSQAESELIALAANLPANSPLHVRVGDLFIQVQDYDAALAQYRDALRPGRNARALAGAGRAAFELGRYESALHYLEEAAAANSPDGRSAALLKTAELVVQMDPFRRQLSSARRGQIVMQAFEDAGTRLKSCAAGSQPAAPSPGSLAARWNELHRRISPRTLRDDPDLLDTAMDLVFAVERQAGPQCGGPSSEDQALLLIAKMHASN